MDSDSGEDLEMKAERKRAEREARRARDVDGDGDTGDTDAASATRRRDRRRRGGDDDVGEGGGSADSGLGDDTDRRARRRERRRRGEGAGAGAGDDMDLKAQQIMSGAALQAAISDTKKRRDQAAAMSRPEVHVIGEIVGGTGFGTGVACKFDIQAGDKWEVLNGETAAQTHVDYPAGEMLVWAHPIDIHYVIGTGHGWPRIQVQVWKLDEFGRNELQGYGFAHIPASAGSFDVEVPTWRPTGSHAVEMSAFFVGGRPQLKDKKLVYEDVRQRFRLTTESAGTVHLHVDVVFKYMDTHKVEW